MLKVCDYEVKEGEKKQVVIGIDMAGQPHDGRVKAQPEGVLRTGVSKGDYEMPATLICGSKPGRTLLVTASIHSGEYPGVPAVIRAAAEIDPSKVTGNLILIHCVNTSGFWTKVPTKIAEDGFNLNGDYPGKEDGTVGERIAAYFIKELFPSADFILDLHSGGPSERMTPCLFYPMAEKVTEAAFAAAKSLDVPYLLASTATCGEYSYAANYFDIPGLLIERGGVSCCLPEWADAYYRDIFLLLAHLGIYEQEGLDRESCAKKAYKKTIYLEAEDTGIWYAAVEENQPVKKGQLLGRIEDFYGNLIREYRAEEDGRVFYYTSGISVEPGDALVAYGVESSAVEA